MSLDLNIVCWEGSHLYYVLRFATPAIILWIIGFPCAAYIYLTINRKKLQLLETREAIGYLYLGLKPKIFFWELILFILKLIMILNSVFLSEFDSIFKVNFLIIKSFP